MKTFRTHIAALIALTALGTSLEAAVIPYTENFNGTAVGNNVPAGWNEAGNIGTTTSGNNTNITIVENPALSGNNQYSFNVNASGNLVAAVQVTGRGSTSPFSVSSTMLIDARNNNTAALTAALGFLGNSALNFDSAYRLQYTVNASSNLGRLEFLRSAAGGGFSSLTVGTLAPVQGNTYTFSLNGTYSGATLNLSATLTDNLSNSVTATATDTNPWDGTYFGFRNASANVNSTAVLNFDNFAVIPEPSTVALLGAALLGTVIFLRRRRAQV